jgi:hypothetical protein
VTPKKGRPVNLELTERQKRVFARVPGGKHRHLSGQIFRLDGGVLAMWPLALHITLQALRPKPFGPATWLGHTEGRRIPCAPLSLGFRIVQPKRTSENVPKIRAFCLGTAILDELH